MESANPFTRHEKTVNLGCCNTVIQRGLGVNILVGESQVSGFGAFLGEPVKRNQYIGEYVGEIISTQEADRRSLIYNKFKISYFFTLNESKVIDGYRFGNTTRFINHGRKNENCYVHIKLVNGEHRIGFFAQNDLAAGTELFFDYGEGFLKKHKLKEVTLQPRDKEEMGEVGDQMLGGGEAEAEAEAEAEVEEEGDLNDSDLIEQALVDIPEYDTDEYEERERGEDRIMSGVQQGSGSKEVKRRQRPKRRAGKPVRYTL